MEQSSKNISILSLLIIYFGMTGYWLHFLKQFWAVQGILYCLFHSKFSIQNCPFRRFLKRGVFSSSVNTVDFRSISSIHLWHLFPIHPHVSKERSIVSNFKIIIWPFDSLNFYQYCLFPSKIIFQELTRNGWKKSINHFNINTK